MKKALLLIENWHLKAFTLLVLLFALTLSGYSQGVAISNTSAPANSSAGLDVNFTNKGLLIPRVDLVSTTSFSPLTAHVAGMVVYNTATANDVKPGLYFNNGTAWVRTVLKDGTASGDMQYWDNFNKIWVNIPIGTTGQKLTINASGIPEWAN